MKNIILAIKPKWAELIYSGKKTVELRRVLPKHLTEGSIIYIYESAPVSIVTGHVLVHDAGEWDCTLVWRWIEYMSCLTHGEYWRYFVGKNNCGLIWLKYPVKYEIPLSLESFGVKRAPQNFCYLRDKL